MGFVFVKLNTGEIVSSNGGLVFRKLSTEPETPIPDPPEPFPRGIDLSNLGLPPGSYTITVTARAPGLRESEHSNAVIYTVE